MRTIARIALVLALVEGGSTVCLADSQAKIDHNYRSPPLAYPDAAQLNGEQGDVLVNIQVGSSGYPNRIRVTQSSGFPDLDNAAVQNAANWRYTPATENGDTVTSWTTVDVRFVLPAPPPAANATPAAAPKPQH